MNKSLLSLLPLLLTASSPSQTVGGGYDTEYQLNGSEAGEHFGKAVANAGDVNGDGIPDVVVGSPDADFGTEQNAGLVTVYSGANGDILHQWRSAVANTEFGGAVAGAGDLDGDGFDDVLIGAINGRNAATNVTGAAYAYSGRTGDRLQKWTPAGIGSEFGTSVGSVGDIDGDGVPDVIFGAPLADQSAAVTDTGRYFIFSGMSNTKIYDSHGVAKGDQAGTVVAGLGDLNGDGIPEFAVSSPGHQVGNGRVVVYSGATGVAHSTFDGPALIGKFGTSVADAGDVDADGVSDIIIGGPARDAGSAYVYSGFNNVQLYRIHGLINGDKFGESVSTAGDMNQDGHADFVIGATQTSVGGASSVGTAYGYSGADGTLLWQHHGDAELDRYGKAIAFLGQTGGTSQLAVTSPWSDSNAGLGSGLVDVLSFQPFLMAENTGISSAAGGRTEFEIDFPAEAGLFEYKLLASGSGNGPFTYGVEIPLTYDSTLQETWDGTQPGAHLGRHHGVLNANGDATALIRIHAGGYSHMVGFAVQIAAVAMPTGGLPEYSSVAVPFSITP